MRKPARGAARFAPPSGRGDGNRIMARLCPYLFVYGTLRQGSGHPLAALLARRARLLGRGRVAGRLYDLGPYPGMTDPLTGGEQVRGDVYELRDANATLAILDAYEGCGPSDPQPRLYERVLTLATLDGGESLTVWVYVYRGPVADGQHLPSGEYTPP
jgi:gamma-glutamylcyclotransferase (GGCT)/AIG2-like uncharacterized protein YtfP